MVPTTAAVTMILVSGIAPTKTFFIIHTMSFVTRGVSGAIAIAMSGLSVTTPTRREHLSTTTPSSQSRLFRFELHIFGVRFDICRTRNDTFNGSKVAFAGGLGKEGVPNGEVEGIEVRKKNILEIILGNFLAQCDKLVTKFGDLLDIFFDREGCVMGDSVKRGAKSNTA